MSIATADRTDRGIALPAALMVMLLMAAITAGFTALVIMDTRVRAMDNTRTQSFYAVHAGLEKLTADLGDLFAANPAPTAAQVNALMATPPALGVTWQNPDGSNGYRITFPVNAQGNPDAEVMNVQQGPFQGLVGLATAYDISVAGRLNLDRSEASLTRRLQTVAIPVFQFGIFSENDLSFFAGPDFNFGGRVHTNQNLFLAEGDNRTLTLADRVTAVGEIIRTHLSNGWNTNTNYRGVVRAITAPNNFRDLTRAEGSLQGTIGSPPNDNWSNLSQGTYNHNVMTGTTGARRLDLPITQFGATPYDLIRRPPQNEHVDAPNIFAERMFALASLRILLSDTAAGITNTPTTSAGATALGTAEPAAFAIANTRPHFAESPGPQQGGDAAGSQRYGSRTPINQPLLGGFLKIEMCNRNLLPAGATMPAAACWQDVTNQILALGYAARQDPDNGNAPNGCADPSPNAIIRLQRFRDRANCWDGQADAARQNGLNFMPLALYDPREALMRDAAPAALNFGGIINYIEIDAGNLARWFRGQIPAGSCPIACTGNLALTANGYTVYVSDRRGNRDAAGNETGEYGFEDVVNSGNADGTPNGGNAEVGENFNAIASLQTYGQTPALPVAGMTSPYCVAINAGAGCPAISRPWTTIDPTNAMDATQEAYVARRQTNIFFRRALKLTNGATLNAVAPGLTGLTIVAENPVYIQGNWNANGSFNGAHVATAVIADSVTLLSGSFNDRRSFEQGNALAGRPATTTWYRLAVISGKGPSFPQPNGTAQDFGTDGGAHNFLRYIEDWGTNGGQTLNYRGSIASMYFSRQATGTYKCCTMVYAPPTRGYNFDADFLTPALLPPRTPMFRDVNITGFSQVIRPQ